MFDNLDLKKLRSMTVDQLKTACKNWIDERIKRQLIVLILALKTLDIDTFQEVKSLIREGDARGQTLEIDEIQDVFGNKIGSIKREFEYYGHDPKSPIHFIRIRKFDMNDIELVGKGQEIEHLSNGKIILRVV